MDDKMLKSFIKDEKIPRLQSIRMPRDLNLGGTKIKKVYTPNLNVVRNKDKSKEFVKKSEIKRKDRILPDRNRQNNNRQGKFVQSSGVFSEGIGVDITRFRERRSNYRDSSERSSMAMPTINKNDWEINRKTEDGVMDDIMGSDDDIEDEKMSLQPITWNEQDFKAPPALKKSIKNEEGSTDISKLTLKGMPEASEYKDEMYSDDNPSLSIWNLPDSFAGKGLSDDPKVTKLFDYTLHDMLEGQVGKFIIRKSGRIQVQIGRIVYDLEESEFSPHKEEIVSFSEPTNGQMDAMVLGEISNRYILNPDWQSLLKQ